MLLPALQDWALCLEMVHIAHFSDRDYVCQLWDLALKEAWQRQWGGGDAAAASSSSSDEDQRAAAALDECCRCVETLGEQFYPNENR